MHRKEDNNTVTRAYIAQEINRRLGYSVAEANELIAGFIEEINKAIKKDEKVKISSFGTFKVINKKARMGRNPKTKEAAEISARKVVSFILSKGLREKINK